MNDAFERLRARIGGGPGDPATRIGIAVSAAWLILVLVFWLAGPSGAPASGLSRLLSAVGVAVPLALIWMAVGLGRAIAELRAEATMLRARMEALRPEERAAADRDAPIPEAPGLDVRKALRPAAPRARPAAPEPRQPDLPLLDQPEPARIAPEDLVAALNFPDGPDDHVAIAALRAALAEPETARTIRAAQDVVTLLAGHGIYLDELSAPPVPPAAWRRYVEGQRGPWTRALATIDEPAALDTAAGLMRGDEVFRDAAHHFLRQYDRSIGRAAPEMDDPLLAAAAETRSGRAFRLLAQVTGMFG